MSEIIGKINQKNFSKLDFDNFSKSKNVPIQKISLENINDTKLLKAGIVNQIYNFPEKQVSASYNIQLTENFLVTNLNNGIVNYYKNFDSAVNAISKISKMKLFDKNKLKKNINYSARIRLFLNVDSLPSPLRPRAYFSSDWNISSQWYRWKI